jgi:hypothetical protein
VRKTPEPHPTSEETEDDDVVQYDHSQDRRVHTTHVNQHEPQKEEEYEEKLRKSGPIKPEQIAFNETAVTHQMYLAKDCDIQGPEITESEYKSNSEEVQDDVVKVGNVRQKPNKLEDFSLGECMRMRPQATPPTTSTTCCAVMLHTITTPQGAPGKRYGHKPEPPVHQSSTSQPVHQSSTVSSRAPKSAGPSMRSVEPTKSYETSRARQTSSYKSSSAGTTSQDLQNQPAQNKSQLAQNESQAKQPAR